MSVINESAKGAELVCLEEFVGPPQGAWPSPETNHRFRVGERVHFAGWYRDENLHDNPVCWMVVFDAADGKRYAATQTYFVTAECWEGLRKHFARQHRKVRPRKNSKTVMLQPARKRQPVATASKKRRSA